MEEHCLLFVFLFVGFFGSLRHRCPRNALLFHSADSQHIWPSMRINNIIFSSCQLQIVVNTIGFFVRNVISPLLIQIAMNMIVPFVGRH